MSKSNCRGASEQPVTMCCKASVNKTVLWSENDARPVSSQSKDTFRRHLKKLCVFSSLSRFLLFAGL